MGTMNGMVAIVTGASRGLGRAIAKEYAREGAKVVVCARQASPTGLSGTIEETVRDIRNTAGEAIAVACDVADEAQVSDMVRQVMERYGRIDVLVNNAAIMVLGKSFLEISPDAWDQSVAVNMRGPFLTCRAVLPAMMSQKRGSIINIGSRSGFDHTQVGSVVYPASKAGMHMFSLTLAQEMREHNIAVNILNPGAMKSEGSAAIPWAWNDWSERVDPEAAAPCAVYLALQDAQSFTGQLVARVDFGKTWGV
ncbi:MAG: SDR family oxidoreductase [Dehalococcoidia bacterium]|nr:SDR family oxidoreductase [Dehalococcoidia bacterium]MDP7085544.1 SDR family oxidoreductase [Dehalococcoidia bacterium]MDP7202287.1 SDR family oxidoreductase [Dehalococcoidia bacterium]HJN88394.1 SDR family oxidoreductase [Dehalococcoidia bacterium]